MCSHMNKPLTHQRCLEWTPSSEQLIYNNEQLLYGKSLISLLPLIQGDCKYILDGGTLVQRLPWPSGLTYDNIYVLYFKFVCQKYGTDSIVVFDGYAEMPSTKDTTHLKA